MAESCCLSTTLVLPEDVLFEILVWLPVQSLLRFRSVCRSWYAVIQSINFIQRHTTADQSNSKLGDTFICQHEIRTLAPTPPFYLLSLEGGFKELEDLGKRPCFEDASTPSRPGCVSMVDSVHGIICMYNGITRDIVIWNPATRQCRLLPKSLDGNLKDGYAHRDFVGLGFDVATKDYKVIQVSSLVPCNNKLGFLNVNMRRKVQIYCLSTDSWRLVDSDFRTHCSYGSFGRSLDGIYFHQGVDYTAEPLGKSVILAFDLSKENYQRVIQIPENNFYQLESIEGDKLAGVTCPRGSCQLYKVWMLKDYNTVKELWIELYRVDLTSPGLNARYGWLGILTISWNGKFSLIGGESLVSYNSITGEFEDLGFGEGLVVCTLMSNIYKESLVSVDANRGSATTAISS